MKDKRKCIYFAAAILCVAVLSGCDKVTIDFNDSTAPRVTLELRMDDGGYRSIISTLDISYKTPQPIDVRCTVNDDKGVKTAKVSYSGTATACFINGAAVSGTFPIQSVPNEISQTLTNDGGKTLGNLVLLSSEPLHGPFSCEVSGSKGIPVGGKIKVNCEGTNWSTVGDAASKASETVSFSVNAIEEDDSTPPNVKVEVKRSPSSEYKEVSKAGVSVTGKDSLDIRCTVEDPEGVSSVRIMFFNAIDKCYLKGDYYGPYSAEPIPDNVSDGVGKSDRVLSLSVMPKTLTGPFICHTPDGKGSPLGQRIRFTCEGNNWSANLGVRQVTKAVEVLIEK